MLEIIIVVECDRWDNMLIWENLYMKNNRIAIVTPSCPPFSFGGISSAHFNLAEMLLSEGYKVCLFTYDDTQRRLEDPSYIKRHGVPKVSSR